MNATNVGRRSPGFSDRRAVLFAAVLAAGAFLGTRTASAAPAPAPSPTPAPQPTAAAAPYLHFLAVDLNLAPKVRNEFDAGQTGRTAPSARLATEYRFLGRNFAELVYRRWDYPRSAVGPGAVVNPARLRDEELELRTSLVALGGHTYLATSALTQANGYGYPRLRASFGLGVERLPDLTRPVTAYASVYYFPELAGKAATGGRQVPLRYRLTTYQAGLAFTVPSSPLFLELGVAGDRYSGKQNAPSDVSRAAVNLGLGARF